MSTRIEKKPAILAGLVYKFKRGRVSSYCSRPGFNCLSPAEDWAEAIEIGDVWICDEHGNIDPGLNVSPVPVARGAIGALIGRRE